MYVSQTTTKFVICLNIELQTLKKYKNKNMLMDFRYFKWNHKHFIFTH